MQGAMRFSYLALIFLVVLVVFLWTFTFLFVPFVSGQLVCFLSCFLVLYVSGISRSSIDWRLGLQDDHFPVPDEWLGEALT